MDDFKIRACPVCGGVADIHINTEKNLYFFVECGNCNLKTGLYASSLEAIKEWNKKTARKQRGTDMDKKYRVYLLNYYCTTDGLEYHTDFDNYKQWLPHFDCDDEQEMNDLVYMLTLYGHQVTVEQIRG